MELLQKVNLGNDTINLILQFPDETGKAADSVRDTDSEIPRKLLEILTAELLEQIRN